MLKKRIIPCLDVRDGRVVKGINFVNIRDAGDPVEVARRYDQQNADELVFLDITASHEGRATVIQMVEQVAEQVFIPFTVGGGIAELSWIKQLLRCGADKVSINSPALIRPAFIDEAASRFGSQCIVVSIDCKRTPDGTYRVYRNGGRIDTGRDAVEWALEVEHRGAGEILLTSMDADGTKAGFDMDITPQIAQAVRIPVIASGGAGTLEHFSRILSPEGGASAALAASLFHYDGVTVAQVKQHCQAQGIPMRME